jgi:hypothetical protein
MKWIQVSIRGMIPWITSMYQSKHTRQKILKRYMKYWRFKLERLNEKFNNYIKQHYKVVDYEVKKPSQRMTYLTWIPYGYSRRIRIIRARRRCIISKNLYVIEAKSAMQKRRAQMEFHMDSYEILIDNCCSHSLTNSKEDFIEPPVKSKIRVRGCNGHTNSTMVGTEKWRVKDDNGKVHSIILPNTYYLPLVETRLLSPQHWVQVRGRKRDTYCITYYDAIIMRWNRDKYQITAPLDNGKHRNVGVMRSISGIKNYLTSCQAFEEINETLAFPATINMDKETEPAVVCDDETSIQGQIRDNKNVQEQVIVNQEPPSSVQIEGQMREEPKEVIFEDDHKVAEEEPVYADDKQKYMHWHYR